jgi:hypothetical protein
MQIEVIDKFGRVRPYRRGDRLEDGERLYMPHVFMDAAARAVRDALAAKYGHVMTDSQPRGYVRGYAFADTTPPRRLQDAAALAYEERRDRLANAWRKNHRDATEDDAPLPTRDARADADRAWLDKKERLQNGWRMK